MNFVYLSLALPSCSTHDKYHKIYIQFFSSLLREWTTFEFARSKYSHTTKKTKTENSTTMSLDRSGLWRRWNGHRNISSHVPDRIVSPREFWILSEHGSMSTIKYFLRISKFPFMISIKDVVKLPKQPAENRHLKTYFFCRVSSHNLILWKNLVDSTAATAVTVQRSNNEDNENQLLLIRCCRLVSVISPARLTFNLVNWMRFVFDFDDES